MLGYPLLVGLVLGLARTDIRVVPGAWLPPGLVWTVQLAAVVAGHMLGAWGGHVVAALDAPREMTAGTLRTRQIPLAVVMVALTTLTLWSLGQALVVTPEEGANVWSPSRTAGIPVQIETAIRG